MEKSEYEIKTKAEKDDECPDYGKQESNDSLPKEIRLVILSSTPHPLDSEIQCQLSTYDDSTNITTERGSKSIDNCPSYEVLSYEPSPVTSKSLRHRIWLNNKLVTVSKNLHLALHSLKNRTSWVQVLWVDELCATVREEDEDEVVPEMRPEDRAARRRLQQAIVERARGLIIWLEDAEHIQVSGPESLGTFELIDAMLHPNHFPLLRTAAKTAQIQGVMKYLKGSSPSTKTLGIVHAFWGTMSRLCHRKHWNQISTIRNMWFARSVQLQFGDEVLLSDDIIKFLFQYMKTFEEKVPKRVSDSQFWTLKSYIQTKTGSETPTMLDFFSLLKLSRNSVCTDSRDKVFDLLGLACDIQESDIEVDYSISIFDLFCKVVESLQLQSQQTSTTNITAICQELQASLLGPDFSDSEFSKMTAARQASQTRARFTVPSVSKGNIEFVSDNPRDLLRLVRVMERAQRSSLANMYHSTFRSDFRRDQRPWEDMLVKTWEMDSGSFSLFEDTKEGQSTERLTGVTMFVTDGIEIGVAPRGVRKGDKLFRFNGEGAVPFQAIVRELDNGGKGSGLKVLGRARSKLEGSLEDGCGPQLAEGSKTSREWTSQSGKARVIEDLKRIQRDLENSELSIAVRNPTLESAVALVAQGVDVVRANLNDLACVKKAVAGSYAVFGVTNFWEILSKWGEYKQGQKIADASKAEGVTDLIWSSLLHATKLSQYTLEAISHFYSNAEVEEYVEKIKGDMKTIYYKPSGFMTNFRASIQPGLDGIPTHFAPMDATKTRFPVIHIKADTRNYVAGILEAGEDANGAHINGFGEWLSPLQLAQTLSKVNGSTFHFAPVPPEIFRGFLTPGMAKELTENLFLIRDFSDYGLGSELHQKESDRFLLPGTKLTICEQFIEENGP